MCDGLIRLIKQKNANTIRIRIYISHKKRILRLLTPSNHVKVLEARIFWCPFPLRRIDEITKLNYLTRLKNTTQLSSERSRRSRTNQL